jgi:hypothetical protein
MLAQKVKSGTARSARSLPLPSRERYRGGMKRAMHAFFAEPNHVKREYKAWRAIRYSGTARFALGLAQGIKGIAAAELSWRVRP